MRHRLKLGLVAALICLLAAVAVGCSGDDESSGGGGDARALLEEAASKRIDSAQMRLRAEADVPGFPILGSLLRLNVEGPIAAGGPGELPTLDWDALLTAGGQELPARLRMVDGRAYVTFQGLDYEADRRLLARVAAMRGGDEEKGDLALLGQFGIDPTEWLTNLRVEEGEEIGGDATRTVTGDVDVAAVIDDLVAAADTPAVRKRAEKSGHDADALQELSDEARAKLEQAIDTAEVAIAIDDDGYARGFDATLEFTMPEDVEDTQIEDGTIEIEVVLEQLDVDVSDVTPPPNPRPLSDLLNLAGVIFGIEEPADLWRAP